MALKTVIDVAQVIMNQRVGDKYTQNVLHFQYLSDFSYLDLSDLADRIVVGVVANMAPLMSVDWTFQSAKAVSVDLDLPFEYTSTPGTPVVGFVMEGSAPINAAAQTAFLTGGIGRSFKGKAYVSGLPKGQVGDYLLDPDLVVDLNLMWGAIAAEALGGDWTHVVVSRVQDHVVIDPADSTPIIQYDTSLAVHDMGRRLDN